MHDKIILASISHLTKLQGAGVGGEYPLLPASLEHKVEKGILESEDEESKSFTTYVNAVKG